MNLLSKEQNRDEMLPTQKLFNYKLQYNNYIELLIHKLYYNIILILSLPVIYYNGNLQYFPSIKSSYFHKYNG